MKINQRCILDILNVVHTLGHGTPITALNKQNYTDHAPLGKYKYDTIVEHFEYCMLNNWIYIDKRFWSFDYYNSLVFSKLTKEGFDEMQRLEKEFDRTFKGFIKRNAPKIAAFFSKVISLFSKIISIFKFFT